MPPMLACVLKRGGLSSKLTIWSFMKLEDLRSLSPAIADGSTIDVGIGCGSG